MAKGTDQNFEYADVAVNRDPDARNWNRDAEDLKRSDVIRSAIRGTRSELDRTIDQLQDRINPRQLMRGMFQSLRDNSGDFTNRAMCTLRNNPIPTALIGLGVIWLFMSQARRSATPIADLEYEEYEGYGERFEPAVRSTAGWSARHPSSGTFQEGQQNDDV